MTPVDFLAQSQVLRPRLIRAAEQITKNRADAEDAVQEAIYYCHTNIHEYDVTRASLETWMMRTVMQRALNARRDAIWRNPQGEAAPEFSDLAPYNDQDVSMREVQATGLEQVRMVEPTQRRAMKKPRRGPEPDLSCSPGFDRALEIQSSLQNLPTHQRQAVEAIYMYGDSVEEYAATRGIPLRTIERWLSEARVVLREDLS